MNRDPQDWKKPFELCRVREDGYTYFGQMMSYPFERDDKQYIMVRRAPGHPGTLSELPVDKLVRIDGKLKHVHYAIVECIVKPVSNDKGFTLESNFPVDMLRYDTAAPVNFELVTDEFDRTVARILPDFAALEDPVFSKQFIIATVSTQRSHDLEWSTERWRSFWWKVQHMKTERIDAAR